MTLNKTENIINRMIAGILFVICMLCFVGDDATIITKWGYTLLECIRTGQFHQYANVLQALGNRTNYSIVVNFMTAAWLSPVYILSRIIGREFDLIIYYTWYKCLIGIAVALAYRKLRRLIMQPSETMAAANAQLTGLIWFSIPCVMLGILAVGQVDAIGVMLLLMAYGCIREERYYQAAAWLAAALCIKALAVMIFIPWILLLWRKSRVKECLAMLGIPAASYLIQYKLADLLFENYNFHAAQFNSNIRFADRLFAVGAGYTSIFLLTVILICYACFYLAARDRVEEWHFAMMPMLVMTVFILCIQWNPQYLIYMVPCLIVLLCTLPSRLDALVCTLLLGLGYVISVPITDPARYDSNGMMDYSFLRLIRGSDYAGLYLEDYLNGISEYTVYIGRSLLSAGVVLLVAMAILEHVGKRSHTKTAPESYPMLEKLVWYANYLPVLAFIAASFTLYF